MNVKVDLGIVELNTIKGINTYDEIKNYMDKEGYNVKYCDICSITQGVKDEEQNEIFFKFVHYSVPTMSTEPYYKIIFKESK